MKGRIEKFLSMRSRRLKVRKHGERYVASVGYQRAACRTYRMFKGRPADTVAEAIENALDVADSELIRWKRTREESGWGKTEK